MIVFRADGNANIGMGHVMRCLSIADAAVEQRTDCLFVTADESVSGAIRERGFRCEVLGSDHTKMEAELPLLEPLLVRERPACVLVDSYFVTPVYLNRVRMLAKTAYLDDVAAFAYPVDLLVNYNIYGDETDYEALYREAGQPLPILLTGTEYAPLRGEFRGLPSRVTRSKATDVLVSTGGSDPRHIALELAGRIARRDDAGVCFHFVLGALNEDTEAIRQIAADCGSVAVHSGVRRMSELMRRCDLAISAAGSTLYELCAAQTPTVTYVLADNQQPGAEGFARRGLMRCAGDWRELGDGLFERLLDAAAELAGDYRERVRMAEAMGCVVDGVGAARLCRRFAALS